MNKASFARRGTGFISKAVTARGGGAKGDALPMSEGQPRVPSNIPGAASQGVPPAEADRMAEFARGGNMNMQAKAVAVQTGEASLGPVISSSLARTGGQIGLSPNQIKAWAQPRDPAPKASGQYGIPAPDSKPIGVP